MLASLRDMRAAARAAEVKQNLKQIEIAAYLYKDKYGDWPPDVGGSVIPTFIPEFLPEWPQFCGGGFPTYDWNNWPSNGITVDIAGVVRFCIDDSTAPGSCNASSFKNLTKVYCN